MSIWEVPPMLRKSMLSVLIPALGAWMTAARADDPKPEAPVAPKPADADAPLPAGFPPATKPGEVEVKHYPAYRSAVAEGREMSVSSGDFLFWPLFRHIQGHDIAMTAPVINNYKTPDLLEKPDARGDVSMEFLYREPTQGATGPDGAVVTVADHPAGDYACLGVQGHMDEKAMREGMAKLRAWLDDHKAEYVASGPPRRLGYHGPMTREAERWWEVQIPVKKVEEPRP
jgi:hypothetical protein